MRESKKLKKTLLIVSIVFVVAAAAVTVWRFTDVKSDNRKLSENKQSKTDAAVLYDFEEAGALNLPESKLREYITLGQFGDFYVSDNEQMLVQAIEQTFVSAMDCKYYIDNRCYSCGFDDGYQYRFFGTDENNLPFYLKISGDGKSAQWYVKNGLSVPYVGKDKVSEIILLKTSDVQTMTFHSADDSDLRRINPDDGISVTDKDVIDKYIMRYSNGNYVFDDKLDDIKKAKENSDCGYVLAHFENSNIYQCIGSY